MSARALPRGGAPDVQTWRLSDHPQWHYSIFFQAADGEKGFSLTRIEQDGRRTSVVVVDATQSRELFELLKGIHE